MVNQNLGYVEHDENYHLIPRHPEQIVHSEPSGGRHLTCPAFQPEAAQRGIIGLVNLITPAYSRVNEYVPEGRADSILSSAIRTFSMPTIF